ncbi:Type I restriction-modification system, specificity subunit S [Clostridiaceae bacterium BL-3]|nr:Type I restriction-modification system, specificity subunit S [Clostridiaceae bacterium BL-3]
MKFTKFKKICSITQGVQIPKSKQIDSKVQGYIRYLYIADFKNNSRKKYVEDVYPQKVVNDRDLIMANTGSPGIVFRGKHGVLSNNLFKINFDEDLLNRDYLFYYLSSNRFQHTIQHQMKGGVQKHLGHQIIGEQFIPVLNMDSQLKIVKVLSKIQELVNKRKTQIELLEELIKSVFYNMFGDLKFNEYKWEKISLKDICNKITDGTHNAPKRVAKGVKFITGKNVKAFKLDLSDLEFVSEEDHREIYKRCNPEYGDVLYTNIGSGAGNAAFNPLHEEFSMKNVALFKLNRNRVNSIFIEYELNYLKDYIVNKYCIGGAQTFLNLKIINDLKLPLPPIELQNKFTTIVRNIENQKKKLQRSLKELQESFNSLIQRAFDGKLFN